jgi:uncharacterized damage-inducible protein DinB
VPDPRIAVLLELLDQAFDKKAWHGPNLSGSFRGIDAKRAMWRPAPGRHSVAEHVVHAAYWKYAVRRRLREEPRGQFPFKGSNWFTLPDPLDERGWHLFTALLRAEHGTLRESVAAFPAERLGKSPVGGKVVFQDLILGIAAHDVYHAGQIQLLKRLQGRGD